MYVIMAIFKKKLIISNNGRKKILLHLKCDICNKKYLCDDRSKNRASKQEFHFCSVKCRKKATSKPNGVLFLKAKKILFNKYGGYFVETSHFKDEQKKLCIEQYGVKSRLEVPEFLEKIKQTNIKKYGKQTFTGSEAHKLKLNYTEIAAKAWITKINNGTCSKSSSEEKLNEILKDAFGKHNVIRQFNILNQWIDFYIKNIDTYIQVDGVYWHGLNRKLSEIKIQKSSQDKKIYKQILRDRKLNRYMKQVGYRLIRLTDEQIDKYNKDQLLLIIKGE